MEEMKGQGGQRVVNEGCEQTMAWRACGFCSMSSGKPLKVFQEGSDMFLFIF